MSEDTKSKQTACVILGHDWHRNDDICMRCGESGSKWARRRAELANTEKWKATLTKMREKT